MNHRVLRIALLTVLAAAIAFAVFNHERFDADALLVSVQDLGVLAPIVFMLIYALATVLFLPGSVLTLAGGALFGPLLGTFCNLSGATLGAALAFLISRYLASGWVAAKAGGRIGQLIDGVESEGWRFVAFVRLVPLFPFNLLNYALGLTKIRFAHYLFATWVFMLPGAIAYTWIGYAGREAVAGGEDLARNILIALALLATAAFLPRLVGAMRRGPGIDIDTLKQRLDDGVTLVLDVRTADEFAGEHGHIGGAMNIPLDQVAARVHELDDYTEWPIALVCHTDLRSAKAARLLAKHGFQDVQVVRGGMTKWTEAGFPVVH